MNNTAGEVSILLEDNEIADTFSTLLEAYGFRTRTLRSPYEISGETILLTEPSYYEELSAALKEECLLVANSWQDLPPNLSKALERVLCRPLTEGKIKRIISFIRKKNGKS